MKVPFADLYKQYLTIKPAVDSAIIKVIKESAFIRGPYVEAFEKSFAEKTQSKYCVSCANGTDSLYIAMKSLGVQPGDEVITTAHSWISTSETISQAGAKPIFVDTDLDTFTIDPLKIENAITERTVGIIPVHLYGQAADMPSIMRIADKYKLWVIEDCAQAHMAKINDKLVGSFGTIASYSFYPGKNLGAMGDAGAITTNDKSLAERMAMFARHGGLNKGEHFIEGINSRLDGLQAAILSVKLEKLELWTKRRQAIAQQYNEFLDGLETVTVPTVYPGREHVFHLYVIRNENRDDLASFLKSKNIQTVVNYPIALPFLPCYSHLQLVPEQYPNAFKNQSQILSIPIFPEMTNEQIEYVANAVKMFNSKVKP